METGERMVVISCPIESRMLVVVLDMVWLGDFVEWVVGNWFPSKKVTEANTRLTLKSSRITNLSLATKIHEHLAICLYVSHGLISTRSISCSLLHQRLKPHNEHAQSNTRQDLHGFPNSGTQQGQRILICKQEELHLSINLNLQVYELSLFPGSLYILIQRHCLETISRRFCHTRTKLYGVEIQHTKPRNQTNDYIYFLTGGDD